MSKPNTTENSPGLDRAIAAQRKKELRLHPLRINRQTVIYVNRDKCNTAYADHYRKNKLKQSL